MDRFPSTTLKANEGRILHPYDGGGVRVYRPVNRHDHKTVTPPDYVDVINIDGDSAGEMTYPVFEGNEEAFDQMELAQAVATGLITDEYLRGLPDDELEELLSGMDKRTLAYVASRSLRTALSKNS